MSDAAVVEEEVEESWRDDLPEDIRGDKSIIEIKSVEDMAKSFINGQKMLGSRIPIPTDEDSIKEIYQKLGTPENVEGYEINLPKIDNVEFHDTDVSGFLEKAHELNLNSTQANALLEFDGQRQAAIAQDRIEHRNAAEASMKQEWGQAYDQNVTIALQAAKAFGDEDFTNFLNETGLGNHPEFIRFAYNIGKEMSEDKLTGEGNPSLIYTPSEAQEKINEILNDQDHPYHKKDRPGHKEAVQKMAGYFQHLSTSGTSG